MLILKKRKAQAIIVPLILIISILLFLTATLSGCSSTPKTTAKTDNTSIKIVSSFYPIYLTLINVAKDIDGISVTNMSEPQTGCLHDYTLTTKDMKKLEDADIFVINGAGMEEFLEGITNRITGLEIVDASEGIELLDGLHAGETNPHVWVSVSGCIEQTKNIAKRLAELDPDNSEKYISNMNEYIEKLEALKDEMNAELEDLPNRKIVTFHEAFPYFAKEFDLDVKAVMSEESGHGAETGMLKDTINIVKEHNIKALFVEPQYQSETAQIISRDTGAKIYTLDPIVTGEADGDKDAYIKKMEDNMAVLKEALSK